MGDLYRVVLQPPGYADPLSQEARLYVQNTATHEVLKRDGTWVKPVEGSALDDSVGYIFPLGAIEELGQAVDQYLGGATHAQTEVAVLREWLATERARVDHMIETFYPPRIIDMGMQRGAVLPTQPRKDPR